MKLSIATAVAAAVLAVAALPAEACNPLFDPNFANMWRRSYFPLPCWQEKALAARERE